ncbi:Uncharacterised protein [Vibrio cholerae]|nr:Uncharacterised protein [Vibrio cholerae]CSI82672.1 Uncharacterised protein [Vibrio cholerae]
MGKPINGNLNRNRTNNNQVNNHRVRKPRDWVVQSRL